MITIGAYVFLVILVHEFGHLLCGLITGYQLISFRVLNMSICKNEDSLKLTLCKFHNSDGQCLMCPPDYKESKSPFFLYMIGGSLFDFAMFLIFFQLSQSLSLSYEIRMLLLVLAHIEFLGFIINIIPHRFNGVISDGLTVLLMLKDKNAVRCWYQHAHLYFELLNGKTYGDIEENTFEILQKYDCDLSNELIAMFKLEQCYYLMYHKKWDEALLMIEEIERYNKTFDSIVKPEKLFILIKLKESSSYIDVLYRNYYKWIKVKKIANIHLERIRLAHDIYLGLDKTDSRNQLKIFMSKLASHPNKVEAIFNTMMLREL